jgi:hypothetical protein
VWCDADVEVKFAMIDSWAQMATATTTGISTRIHTNPPVDVGGGYDITSRYSSELTNLELNVRRRLDRLPRVSLMAGFRYVELDERLDAALVGTVTTFVYETNVQNRLYGFQVGGDLDLLACRSLCVRGFAKAGIFGNAGANSGGVGVIGQLPTATVLDRGYRTSFVGETGLSARYCFGHGLALRADYRVMWIDGVCLASDQLAATSYLPLPGSGVDTTGGAFYHGLFLGFDWSF